MRNVFIVLLLVMAVAACSTNSVRYSPTEISKFPPDIQGRIRGEEVSIGMTPEMVRLSWGAPTQVSVLKPLDDGRLREEWLYETFLHENRLIFIDGALGEIMSTKSGKVNEKGK